MSESNLDVRRVVDLLQADKPLTLSTKTRVDQATADSFRKEFGDWPDGGPDTLSISFVTTVESGELTVWPADENGRKTGEPVTTPVESLELTTQYEIHGAFWPHPDGALVLATNPAKTIRLEGKADFGTTDSAVVHESRRARNSRFGLIDPFAPKAPTLPLFDEPEAEPKPTRGKAIERTPTIVLPASQPYRAAVAGIMRIGQDGRPNTLGEIVVPDAIGNGLNYKVGAEIGTEPERARWTQQLAAAQSTLTLKALTGSLLLWMEETGATRYDAYAEATMARIMKYGGAQSNLSGEYIGLWLDAWRPLVQSWVEVPVNERPARRGRPPQKIGQRYQRILASDQMDVIQATDGSGAHLLAARFHPGEWFYNDVFADEGKQLYAVSREITKLDAKRDAWEIRLAYYLFPLFLYNRNNPQGLPWISAERLRDQAVLNYQAKNPQRFIPQLIDALRKIERLGIVGQVDIRDPGENVAPRLRIAGFQVKVHAPNR